MNTLLLSNDWNVLLLSNDWRNPFQVSLSIHKIKLSRG